MAKKKYTSQEVERGRRIAAAVISVELGLSYEAAFQAYAQGQQPGELWVDAGIDLARLVREARRQNVDEAAKRAAKPKN